MNFVVGFVAQRHFGFVIYLGLTLFPIKLTGDLSEGCRRF